VWATEHAEVKNEFVATVLVDGFMVGERQQIFPIRDQGSDVNKLATTHLA
jgi:hypothetical protein